MAINIQFKNNLNKPKSKYPYIGIMHDQENKIIVYFTEPQTGLCISHYDKLYVNNYYNNWAEDDFVEYSGQIILENT